MGRSVSAREAAFLILLCLGIGTLLGGVLRTRLNWRRDIPPYGRRTNSLDVILHPERYAEGPALRAIRALNLAGAALLAGAVGLLVAEACRTIAGR